MKKKSNNKKLTLAVIVFTVVIMSSGRGFTRDAVKADSLPYKKAVAKLVNILSDLDQVTQDVSKRGWQDNEEIITLHRNNREAIELFKQVTQQESDGFIFGEKPQQYTAMTKLPYYVNEMNLFRLSLLEAKMLESKNLYAQAEENYLATTRFMIHLSQQKFSMLLSFIIQDICLNLASPYLEKSAQSKLFSKEYKRDLLNNLLSIRKNQDFLESAFREEAQMSKNNARLIEEEHKKGATFDELFALSKEGETTDKQQRKYKARDKELTAMLDSDFFLEFYRQVDSTIDDFAQTSILATKENNPKIYEQKHQEFINSIEKFGNPLYRLLYSLKQTVIEGKPRKLYAAELLANVFLTISIPRYSRLIERYHNFYNKLSLLIEKVKQGQDK
ncbi:hypothetical protein ACFL2Y_02090 [Candidatus Omnitrophota bacterium]